MYGSWLYLENVEQVETIPVLNAQAALKVFEAQEYTLKHQLGTVYDLWSHAFLQQAERLAIVLINNVDSNLLVEALAELQPELVSEDDSYTTSFYGLLARFGIKSQ